VVCEVVKVLIGEKPKSSLTDQAHDLYVWMLIYAGREDEL
jgi:hypothetical protein